jgi:hypothetical protein
MTVLLDLLERAVEPRTVRRVVIAASVILPVLVATVAGVLWWLWPEPTILADPRAPVVEDQDDGDFEIHSREPGHAVQLHFPLGVDEEARPKQPPLTEPQKEQLKREGLDALSDTIRGKSVDPEAYDGLDEASETELIAATVAGVLQKDADAHEDKGGFTHPQWDGKSDLVCMMGDKFVIENLEIDAPDVAITAMYGCQLHLVNCNARARVVVQAMVRSQVTITGGTMKPTESFVHNMLGHVVVANVKVEGEPIAAIDAEGGHTEVVESELRGKTAVDAGTKARVHIENSKLIGSEAAVHSMHGALVELVATTYSGKLTKAHEGRIEVLAESEK